MRPTAGTPRSTSATWATRSTWPPAWRGVTASWARAARWSADCVTTSDALLRGRPMFASLPALAATLGGTGLLFLSWRRALGELPPLCWAGWGLLLLALYLWVAGHGAEVGLLLGLFVPALAAWVLVAWQTGREQARGRRRGREANAGAADSPAGSKSRPTGRAWLRHLGLFLLCVPLAFGSAT